MPPEVTRAPPAPARSPSASTSTSTSSSTAGSTSTASAGNSAATADAGLGAPVSEGGLDGLRNATGEGLADEAWAVFGSLSPGDIATLKADTAFVPRFLHLVGPEHAATALWTLQYPIRLYLELANIHCAAQVASLSHVLADVGIHGASDLSHHTADLNGLGAFLLSVVLDPLLAVSSPEEDALLLGTTGGHDLLLPAYTDSPLEFMVFLGTAPDVVLDLFLTSEPARAWLLETPTVLVGFIVYQWDAAGPWYRALATTLPSELNGLVGADPSTWATAFIDLFVAGDPQDTALLTPPGDTFRLVIGVIAAQDPVAAAQACATLSLDRIQCLLVFAAEGWLTLESASALLAGTDVNTQILVAANGPLCAALAPLAWFADLLPLVAATPALAVPFYAIVPEFRAWVHVDPARFETMAKADPALWVPFFVVANDVSMLLLFSANDPATWRAAVNDALYIGVLGVLPKPCAESDVPGVWALWKEANRSVAAGLETFYTLYGLRIWTTGAHPERMLGDTVEAGITYEVKQIIATVEPSQEALNDYLAHLEVLPRGQVASSAVGFGHGWEIHYKRKTPPADATFGQSKAFDVEDGGTSQYWDVMNFVLMYTDSTGAISGPTAVAEDVDWIAGPQRVSSDGNPSGTGGTGTDTDGSGVTTPRDATTDTALTYFQNHARHEVGHGVGARAFTGMATSGDETARTFSKWENSSDADMRAGYFAGRTGNVTDVMDGTGADQTVPASEIGLWLTEVVSTGGEPTTSTVAGTGGMMTAVPGTLRDRIDGIRWSSVGDSDLAKYVDAVASSNNPSNIPTGAYEYPGFTPSGNTAYIYSNAQDGFRKYDTAVMTELAPTIGWYSLSSHSEMFAEIYTQHYSTSAGWVPTGRHSVDWGTFFTDLEASPQSALQAGVPPVIAGVGGAPAPAAAAPAPAPVGGSPTPGPSGAGGSAGVAPAVSAMARGTPI